MDQVLRIEKVLAVAGCGSYFYEDVASLQSNPIPVKDRYRAEAATPGFKFIREPGEVVSVGLRLENGQVVWGDCVSVVYGGKAGRANVFRAAEGLEEVKHRVAPWLEGYTLRSFREVSRVLPAASHAVSYGVSQALLGAVAMSRRRTMAEVICEEWDLPLPQAPVAFHAVCADRVDGPDKMLIRGVDSLPHLLVDDIPEQLGAEGEKFLPYVEWLRRRSDELHSKNRPTFHFDFHGALGRLFAGDLQRIGRFIDQISRAAHPYSVRVESVHLTEDAVSQINFYRTLKQWLASRQVKAELVADEWANDLDQIRRFAESRSVDMIHVKTPDLGSLENTVEAVLSCRANGVKVLQGGSVNETEISAKACAHVALSTRPDLMMLKPGMGIDEANAIVRNEMARALSEMAR